MQYLIDHTIFLGTHSCDEQVRLACKNFFCIALEKFKVRMPLNEVGICDKYIWQRKYEMQEKYYPFMDYLHTLLKVDLFEYSEDQIKSALLLSDRDTIYDRLYRVSTQSSFPLSLKKNRLDNCHLSIVDKFGYYDEMLFPGRLESYYQESLILKFSDDE